MNYRKIWVTHYGKIPKDEQGRTFDIHHIDGNRKNNDINNLICVSMEDHYKIHLEQFNKTLSFKERASLNFLAKRINKPLGQLTGFTVSDETKEKIRKKLTGTKRPDELKKKLSEVRKNCKWSEEIIKKRSEGLKNIIKI